MIFSIGSLLDPFSYGIVTAAEDEELVGLMTEISTGMSDAVGKFASFSAPALVAVACTLLVSLLTTDGFKPDIPTRGVVPSVDAAIVMVPVLETSSPRILLTLLPAVEISFLDSPVVTVVCGTLVI